MYVVWQRDTFKCVCMYTQTSLLQGKQGRNRSPWHAARNHSTGRYIAPFGRKSIPILLLSASCCSTVALVACCCTVPQEHMCCPPPPDSQLAAHVTSGHDARHCCVGHPLVAAGGMTASASPARPPPSWCRADGLCRCWHPHQLWCCLAQPNPRHPA